MTLYRRTRPGWRETLTSSLLAAGVGAATFYFARLLLSKERLAVRPPVPVEGQDVGSDRGLDDGAAQAPSLTPGAETG